MIYIMTILTIKFNYVQDYVVLYREDSKGARMEYDVANICGIPVDFYCNHFSKLLP